MRLRTVGASVVAAYWKRRLLRLSSVKVTETSTLPGKPVHLVRSAQPSPAGLCRVSFRPTVPLAGGISAAFHITLSKPVKPPWSVLPLLFASSV